MYIHGVDYCTLWLFLLVSKVSRTTAKSVVTLSKRSASKGLGNDFTANANEMQRSLDSASQNYCMIATSNHGNL